MVEKCCVWSFLFDIGFVIFIQGVSCFA